MSCPETQLEGMSGSFGYFSIDTLTIRKSVLDKLNPWMKTHLRLHQDTEFLFRLSYYCKLYPGIIDKAIAKRGVHESNRITEVIGKSKQQSKKAMNKVLLWHEINFWAQSESNLNKDIKLHIKRTHRSWKIAQAPIPKKLSMIIKYLILDYQSIRSGLYNINFRNF